MVFASLEFLTLFLPLFLCTYAVCPAAWRNVTLLIGSWLFLWLVEPPVPRSACGADDHGVGRRFAD